MKSIGILIYRAYALIRAVSIYHRIDLFIYRDMQILQKF